MKRGGEKSSYKSDKAVEFTVEKIIENALNLRATDVHIEPREDSTLVRFRIHGALRDIEKLPKTYSQKLAKHFKFLGDLDFSEKNFAQTAQIKHGNSNIRVSIAPTFLGEKITLRVLSAKSRVRTLEEIGIWGENLRLIQQALRQPHGIIFTIGQGKNNTNFALINELVSSEKNIVTVEKHIEKAIPNLNQTSVNPRIGLDCFRATQSALNQNPDVIMVDDVRDSKTAELLFDAAARGKLVIASVPVQHISEVIPYLEFLGIPNFLLATNILAVVSQKLVRTAAKTALEFRKINKTESQVLANEFKIQIPTIHELEKAATKHFGEKTHTSELSILEIPQMKSEFSEIGFTGVTGIFEVMSFIEGKFGRELRNLVAHSPNSAEIEDFLDENSFVSLKTDGLLKALQGQTTVREIMRRTGF